MNHEKRNFLLASLLFVIIIVLIATLIFLTHAPNEKRTDPPPATTIEIETMLPDEAADIPSDDWRLVLVNQANPLPDGFSVELTELMYQQSIDSRAYPDLQQMMDDCRAEGLAPQICSSYRSYETQKRLFDREVSRLISSGYSQTDAEIQAATCVAVPGTSEHQLGLALDIVDQSYPTLDKKQALTGVQQWLMAHSWEYGFVLRYPYEKDEITGTIYEPWHYRYVGKNAAREMYEQDLCLEEYLDRQP